MECFSSAALRGYCRRLALFAGLLVAALLTGCASFYVDTATKEVPAADFTKPANPRPVHFLFEFQTKGVANSRATDLLKGQIVDQVKGAGLFAAVEDKPVADGAILSIKLNNVPLTDNAFGKGFVTWLTFGLAGNQVTDGYVCTVEYLGAGAAEPVRKTARHAIHTVIGAKEAPPNATPVEGIEAAVRTMTRQIVSSALKALSDDPGFR